MVLSLSAAAQRPDTDLYAQSSEVNNIMVQYEADRAILNRFYAIRNSPERRERMEQLYAEYRQRLNALDWSRLPTGSRVDYVLFNRNLSSEWHAAQVEQKEVAQLKSWFPFADSIYAAEARRRRGLTPDARKLAATWNQVAKDVKAKQAQLAKDSSLTPELGLRGLGAARGLQQAVRSTYDFMSATTRSSPGGCPRPTGNSIAC